MLLEISANVQGIKKALIAKDFIDMDGDTVSFNDPFFKNCGSEETLRSFDGIRIYKAFFIRRCAIRPWNTFFK